MVEAEYIAFELMIILASGFGTDYLAAQGILIAISVGCYQFPFSMSITASTRVAVLIGAGRIGAAKTAAKVVCMNSWLQVTGRFRANVKRMDIDKTWLPGNCCNRNCWLPTNGHLDSTQGPAAICLH